MGCISFVSAPLILTPLNHHCHHHHHDHTQVGTALRPLHDKLDNVLMALNSIKDKADLHPKDLRPYRCV